MFSEISTATGLNFTHRNGAEGLFLFPEIMGAGGALLDYDRDGDLDIYLVQSGKLGRAGAEEEGNRLFRNELVPTGVLRFVDVTALSGTGDTGYGMGAAVGDYDNDGWPDIYVTNVGANRLLRNRGDQTFEDVTETTGTGDESWGSSALFLDYDLDGDQDLFVVNYVRYSVAGNVECRTHSGNLDYCAPASYDSAPDVLLRNEGSRFRDVSAAAGVTRSYGNGLGLVSGDFNQDGWPDIYIANDQSANILWINDGHGRFSDEALMSGVAFNGEGAVEAGMGVALGDIEADGDEDIFVTHLNGETNTLYVNDGSGLFADSTSLAGLAVDSIPVTGFGTRFLDLENDGDLDLFAVNGAVTLSASAGEAASPFGQFNQLFLNDSAGRFRASASLGYEWSEDKEASRGALFGDIDNDGDTDVVVLNNHGAARLLQNKVGHLRSWLGVKLINSSGRVSGGRVALLAREGNATVWARASRDGSYLSSSDPRVILGLDQEHRPSSVGVVWPDGTRERYGGLSPRRWHDLVQGEGAEWH